MAQHGRNPDPMEIWEIACALGVHRPKVTPFGLMTTPVGAAVDPVAEMVAAAKAARDGNGTPEWSAPSEQEESSVRALLRATGRG